jgi:hypothetical protein
MGKSRLRYVELLEGGGGNRLSMTRLLMFLAFWPATYVVVVEPSGETLGWYLGAFVLGYVGGKGADVFMGHQKLEATGDSDTVSDTAVTSHVVEKRSVKSTGARKRPF